jgi:type II secretory pathway predicted ATPase ExeA
MLDTHFGNVTIQTRAYTILEDIISDVLAGAGLAVVRGPVGIGKSFALEGLRDHFEEQGHRVVMVTGCPEIEGSIGSFCRAVLSQYGINGGVASSAAESLSDFLLSAFPFQPHRGRLVFIVDEAQGLKTNVLETIRGIWDRGDAARLGNIYRPAFGCVLVGNDSFFNKGGRIKKAEFRPLMSRVTHNVDLPRPGADEYATLALALLPDDTEARVMLEKMGADAGNLRTMTRRYQQANRAAKGDVTTADLRRAALYDGGK